MHACAAVRVVGCESNFAAVRCVRVAVREAGAAREGAASGAASSRRLGAARACSARRTARRRVAVVRAAIAACVKARRARERALRLRARSNAVRGHGANRVAASAVRGVRHEVDALVRAKRRCLRAAARRACEARARRCAYRRGRGTDGVARAAVRSLRQIGLASRRRVPVAVGVARLARRDRARARRARRARAWKRARHAHRYAAAVERIVGVDARAEAVFLSGAARRAGVGRERRVGRGRGVEQRRSGVEHDARVARGRRRGVDDVERGRVGGGVVAESPGIVAEHAVAREEAGRDERRGEGSSDGAHQNFPATLMPDMPGPIIGATSARRDVVGIAWDATEGAARYVTIPPRKTAAPAPSVIVATLP